MVWQAHTCSQPCTQPPPLPPPLPPPARPLSHRFCAASVQAVWRQAASYSAEASASGAAADAAPSSSPAEPTQAQPAETAAAEAAAAQAATVSAADAAAAAAAAEAAAPVWAAHTGVKTLDGLPMPSWIVAVPKPKRSPMGLQVRLGMLLVMRWASCLMCWAYFTRASCSLVRLAAAHPASVFSPSISKLATRAMLLHLPPRSRPAGLKLPNVCALLLACFPTGGDQGGAGGGASQV